MTEHSESMRLELRRGVLALTVLTTLRREHYGYSLRRQLLALGLEIEEGTLYPLLRRLEGFGLLHSRWSSEEGRRRRYYRISQAGEAMRAALAQEWRVLGGVLRSVEEETT